MRDIAPFSAWLCDSFHGWQGQSPDEGECLRLWRWDMPTLTIRMDGKRTICDRYVYWKWLVFCCFRDG